MPVKLRWSVARAQAPATALLPALLLVCCREQPREPARTVVLPQAPAADRAPAAGPVAAVQPPAPATPAVVDKGPSYSIALHIAAGKDGTAALPRVGEPARLRITPIDARLGRPIAQLEPLFGSQVVAVLSRADDSWVKVEGAPGLTDGGSHTFATRFDQAGAHVLFFVFHPQGAGLTAVPVFIDVQGQAKPLAGSEEPGLVFTDSSRLEVRLATSAAAAEVCRPFTVASRWTRGGKPLELAPIGVEGARSLYLARRTAGSAFAVSNWLAEPGPRSTDGPARSVPTEEAVVIDGDIGTRARLLLPGPGLWRVLALAQSGKKVLWATFRVRAEGMDQPDGCPR